MLCSLNGAQRMFEYDDLAMAMGKMCSYKRSSQGSAIVCTWNSAVLIIQDDDTRSHSRGLFDDRMGALPDEGAKRIKVSTPHPAQD